MNIRLEQATDPRRPSYFRFTSRRLFTVARNVQDYATNPANETIDRVYQRINYPNGRFFKIIAEDRLVGAICILWKEDIHFRISPIFLAPNAQGNGFAQQAMRLAEARYPQADTWELSSLLEETRTCQLYEKMGYVETGVRKPLNDKATLIHYQKIMA